MNYKKLIAMAVAFTISALVGSTVMAHGGGFGGGGGGGHGGGFGASADNQFKKSPVLKTGQHFSSSLASRNLLLHLLYSTTGAGGGDYRQVDINDNATL